MQSGTPQVSKKEIGVGVGALIDGGKRDQADSAMIWGPMVHSLVASNGARSRNRTGTFFRTTDFKSVASTNSATRAGFLAVEGNMEARDGIEPTYAALQAAA